MNNSVNNCQVPRPKRAFTLVELLVVIFIIALLALLILGAVHYAQRSSRISKTKADLAAISTAIEQYYSDFKIYPGMSDPNPAPGMMRHTILAQALMGPGPATEDGENGPGFRVVTNVNTGTFDPNAKKWDPYLAPEHFKVQKFTNGWAILDYFGNPIRYLPKRRTLNVKSPNSLVDSPTGVAPSVCIFDARDGEHPQTGTIDLTLDTLQVIMGDSNNDNLIDGDENFAVESNFILASPGPDELFTAFVAKESPSVRHQKSGKSDDIYNFEQK
jgi:prepilin-type N-terminal cleavage/methylation domain-containing protein